MKRNTILAIALVSLCFLSPGLVAKTAPGAETQPKPEEIKFIPATAEQQKKSPEGMVYVPAGEVMMGCNEDVDIFCNSDEKPYHKVYLDAFYIDKYEVTVDQVAKCFKKDKCMKDEPGTDSLGICNWENPERGNHPINCVSWNQANAYCKWAGKRLPTEAEWEKAARGTDGRMFPWGNDTPSCEYVVFFETLGAGCGIGTTWKVGSKPKGISPYGALDMVGNVSEWVEDWYSDNYYSSRSSKNPPGPDSGTYRVLRGASYNNFGDAMKDLRASRRDKDEFDTFTDKYGFRCAKTP